MFFLCFCYLVFIGVLGVALNLLILLLYAACKEVTNTEELHLDHKAIKEGYIRVKTKQNLSPLKLFSQRVQLSPKGSPGLLNKPILKFSRYVRIILLFGPIIFESLFSGKPLEKESGNHIFGLF